MTRGRCGSLFLHRATLAFAPPRRFIPAHRSEATLGRRSVVELGLASAPRSRRSTCRRRDGPGASGGLGRPRAIPAAGISRVVAWAVARSPRLPFRQDGVRTAQPGPAGTAASWTPARGEVMKRIAWELGGIARRRTRGFGATAARSGIRGAGGGLCRRPRQASSSGGGRRSVGCKENRNGRQTPPAVSVGQLLERTSS
jgi:hypothetical protein